MTKAKPKKKPKVRVVPIGEVMEQPSNTRDHDKRNRGVIGESLKRFGAARSIVSKGGVTRAGSGTLVEAKSLGIDEAIIVTTDGSQLVVVEREDWTEDQAELYGITDNRASDLSANAYDELQTQMRGQVEAGETPESLQSLGWERYELAPILGRWQAPGLSSEEFGPQDQGDRQAMRIFMATQDQFTIIIEAVEALRLAEEDTSMSKGRCLELICADFLAGMRKEADGEAGR